MEKYWQLNLVSIRAEGTSMFEESFSNSCRLWYFSHKISEQYRVNNYLKSRVITKNTRSEFFEHSNKPYRYSEIKRRFIIPSEVTISKKRYERIYNNDVGLVDREKQQSIIRYVVDEKEELLKPVEIIYFYVKVETNYKNYANRVFEKVYNRVFVTYNRNKNFYKFYRNFDNDCIDDLQGIEARREIEKYLMSYTYEVKPVENVEHEIVCSV